jgi:D-sedoheptulose 7-phosphate isomerase
MNSFSPDISRPGLAAIALTTDTSFLTAHANDFQFETVFSRQVEALAKEGDILIAITTSGKSGNCMQAVRTANQMGISTISFTKQGGKIAELTEMALEIRSDNTQHIQELHLISYHIIVEIVETTLYR